MTGPEVATVRIWATAEKLHGTKRRPSDTRQGNREQRCACLRLQAEERQRACHGPWATCVLG
eukprot:2923760-Alexandrium_andersonii.AAC.1